MALMKASKLMPMKNLLLDGWQRSREGPGNGFRRLDIGYGVIR